MRQTVQLFVCVTRVCVSLRARFVFGKNVDAHQSGFTEFPHADRFLAVITIALGFLMFYIGLSGSQSCKQEKFPSMYL